MKLYLKNQLTFNVKMSLVIIIEYQIYTKLKMCTMERRQM